LTEQESTFVLRKVDKKSINPRKIYQEMNNQRAKSGKKPGRYHRWGSFLRKDGEGKNADALKQACWHDGHGGHKCHKGLPRQRCKTPRPLLCYKRHTGSSSSIISLYVQIKPVIICSYRERREKVRRKNKKRTVGWAKIWKGRERDDKYNISTT
jgi:hypothetical protein